MSSSGSDELRAALPLTVAEVALTGPVLTLSGEHWYLTVWCDWAVPQLGFDVDSEDVEDRAWDLIGYRIEGVEVRGDGPTFRLGGGVDLVLVEGDDDDPWVLKVPGMAYTGGVRWLS